MAGHERPAGIALVYTFQGTLVRVLRDDLGLGKRVALGQEFSQLVDHGSVDKAGRFLAALQANQAAFDWELYIPIGSEAISLHFAGSAPHRTGW